MGVIADQWDPYVSEIYRVLKPGEGWFQCAEVAGLLRCPDGSYPADGLILDVFRGVTGG
jgi:hypothetical protein